MKIWLNFAVMALPTGLCAQSTMVVGAPQPNVIHMGTALQLETRDELTTENKALRVKQQIELDVLQPILIDSKVAIPAGSRAFGEIMSVRNKGMWGKSGGFTARLLYVEANGRQIRLNGSFNERGDTGTAGVVASVALLPVAGFFVTGTSARLAPGTHVTGFIGEEVTVQFANTLSATAAAVVPSPAPGAAQTTQVVKRP